MYVSIKPKIYSIQLQCNSEVMFTVSHVAHNAMPKVARWDRRKRCGSTLVLRSAQLFHFLICTHLYILLKRISFRASRSSCPSATRALTSGTERGGSCTSVLRNNEAWVLPRMAENLTQHCNAAAEFSWNRQKHQTNLSAFDLHNIRAKHITVLLFWYQFKRVTGCNLFPLEGDTNLIGLLVVICKSR